MSFFKLEITHPDSNSYITTMRINETNEWLCAYNMHSYTDSVMECLGWCLTVLRRYPNDLLNYPLKWQESSETFAREVYLKHLIERIPMLPTGPCLMSSTVVIVF